MLNFHLVALLNLSCTSLVSCSHCAVDSIFYNRIYLYIYVFFSLDFFCLLIWQIASQFFDYSWNLWQTDLQKILHGFLVLAQNNPELHQDDMYLICERWFLCSKIIRQLIVSGFQSDSKSIQVKLLLLCISSHLLSFLSFWLLVSCETAFLHPFPCSL